LADARPAAIDDHVALHSGGNQQKVLCCNLADKARA
jgi:hypothetical protein